MISRSAPPPLEPALVEEGVESLAEILAHEHGGVCHHDQIALVVCVVFSAIPGRHSEVGNLSALS
jgi:hypothetical protein